MTIHVDGARSRRRLPAAKKALQMLKTLPENFFQKCGMRDGFLFKVTRTGKGWIKAPFGVYVVLSDEKGLRQFTCDSVGSPALPWFVATEKDRYTLFPDPMPTAIPSDTFYAIGGSTGNQMLQADPENYIVAPEAQWKSAQPTCLPMGSELLAVNFCYQRTSSHWVQSTQLTHCYNNGAKDVVNEVDLPSVTTTYTIGSGLTANYDPGRRIPLMMLPGYFEYVEWKPHYVFLRAAAPRYPQVLTYVYIDIPSGVVGSYALAVDVLYIGASSNFLADVLSSDVPVRQLAAHYSRLTNDVKGVCALYAPLDPTSYTPSGDRKWILTLSFVSLAGTHQTRTFDDMKTTLYALAGGELKWVPDALLPSLGITFSPPFDYLDPDTTDPQRVMAKYILGVLFGWPADSEHTRSERDTVTFADSTGTVYSWLRSCDAGATQSAWGAMSVGPRNGGFRFSYADGGIGRTSLVMPSAVLTDITLRPKILRMTGTTYCCMADRADGTIQNLYIGSPFGTWYPITLPVDTTMYAIRVVIPADTVAEVSFIGIGKVGTKYHVFFKTPDAEWVKLSPIPVEGDVVDLAASWDVCVFGDDAIVKKMMETAQHPTASYARRPGLR